VNAMSAPSAESTRARSMNGHDDRNHRHGRHRHHRHSRRLSAAVVGEPVAPLSSSSSGSSNLPGVSRTKAAKAAFESGDVEASRLVHQSTHVAEAGHQKGGEFVKSIVYGSMDGIVTTFSVVSGVVGGRIAVGAVLILGFSNMLGDGLAMGLGDYMSSSAELKYAMKEREREVWECENDLDSEKREMIELYSKKEGISEADAKQIVDIISRNQQTFVDIMMVEELGLMPPSPDDSPWKNGLVTFIAFIVCGSIPLIPYIVDVAVNGSASLAIADATFGASIALTAATMFMLGAVTSKFTPQHWTVAGGFQLLVGSFAAGSTFLVAYLLRLAVGGNEVNC